MLNAADSITVRTLLKKQKEERGNKVCLTSANTDEKISFKELYNKTNQVGNALTSIGIKKRSMVATIGINSFESVFVWLGCAVIGAIEVPINNAYKGKMLSYVLNDSEAELLVIHSSFLNRLVDVFEDLKYIKTVIVVGDYPVDTKESLSSVTLMTWENFLKDSNDTLPPTDEPINNSDIIHMIYTSGTTGQSKGVLCTFAQVYETTVASRASSESSCTYNPLPLHHIGGRTPFYGSLIYGYSVVIRDRFQTGKFWSDINKYQCTNTLLLGAMANFIYKQPPTDECKENTLEWIAMIPLIPEVENFKKRFQLEVKTSYNMTEICAPIVSDGFNLKDNKSCGKAREGFEVRLVNEMDEEVPNGEVGEMILRADKPWVFMSGYWKAPEKTVHAWRNQWFHTGDLFTRDAEGNYYYVDRVKDAIRRRGENISSIEVENEINTYPKVIESAVVGIASSYGEEEIKVYIVKNPNESLTPQELINYLIPRMPHFMIPRYIEIVEELPKTETQKIKKELLRKRGVTEDTWDREKAGISVSNLP